MKKLLTLLFLLIASPAWATYFHVSDCATIPGPEEADVCAQLTTASGRTSGHLYIYRSAAWVDVDSAGTGAPTNTTYITQTPDGGLSNEQALSTLATGIVKNTTTTGVLSIASPGTDYVAPTGSGAGLTALNASALASGTVPTARLGSGTANSTTFLAGDNTWTTVSVGSLAADGANCSAGNAPLGVDAAGAAQNCFDVATQVELNTHSGLTGTSAHGATTTNTASQIVSRDASGNFAAGVITATLTGNVTGNVTGNAATATTAATASTLATAGWIPPVVTVATLPATPANGQEVTVSDALTALDCETGAGAFRNRCVWNSGTAHWELIAASSSTPTLDAVMTAGNTTSHCTEADPCQFGNGTVYINIYCNDLNVCYNETSEPSDLYLRARTDHHLIIYDEELAAPILTIDPDNATTLGMYTFGTNYKPKKTIDFPAASVTVDGTQCAQPALATINSGAPRYTVVCADNDASSIYFEAVMPDAYDGGPVTVNHRYVQTAADTGVLNGDIAASCRLAASTINNTWGTEVAIDDAAVTGSNAIDMTTSAAVTPNGTCTAGVPRLLQFRYQLDAGGTTTAVATLHHLGFTVKYSVTSLSD